MPQPIPPGPLSENSARSLTRLLEDVAALGRLSAAPPLAVAWQGRQPNLHLRADPGGRWAEITGSGGTPVAYSWKRKVETDPGVWDDADPPEEGTLNAYPAPGGVAPDVGDVVWLVPNRTVPETWEFQAPGGGSAEFDHLGGGGWLAQFNPYIPTVHNSKGIGTPQDLVTLTDNSVDWIIWVGVSGWLEVPSGSVWGGGDEQAFWRMYAQGSFSVTPPGGSIAGGGTVFAGNLYKESIVYPFAYSNQLGYQYLEGTLSFPMLLKAGFTNPTTIRGGAALQIRGTGAGGPPFIFRCKACYSALAVPGTQMGLTPLAGCKSVVNAIAGYSPPAGGDLGTISPDFEYTSEDDGSGTAALVAFTYIGLGDAPTTYDWDFGDGGTDTVQNPTHVFSTLGTQTVTLVVDSGLATEQTLVRDIEATL